jgi:hypothetical protein
MRYAIAAHHLHQGPPEYAQIKTQRLSLQACLLLQHSQNPASYKTIASCHEQFHSKLACLLSVRSKSRCNILHVFECVSVLRAVDKQLALKSPQAIVLPGPL